MIRNPLHTAVFQIALTELSNVAGNVAIVIPGVTNARSELVAVSFTLTTDATVASRSPYVQLQSPSLTMDMAFHTLPTTASLISRYLFGKGLNPVSDVDSRAYQCPLPDDVYLFENWNINIHLTNGVAGDVMSAIRTYHKVWTFEQ